MAQFKKKESTRSDIFRSLPHLTQLHSLIVGKGHKNLLHFIGDGGLWAPTLEGT